MKENNYLTGYCPNCYSKIDFDPNEKAVQCPACEANISVSNVITNLNGSSQSSREVNSNVPDVSHFISQIETAESGLAYLQNYFENMDWKDYNKYSAIYIADIQQMVEKNKIKNAANPQTWLLEFESISLPLSKKIDGLNELCQEMAKVYNPDDSTNVYSIYDLYKKNCRAIIANRESLLKTLSLDIKYAEKYGLEESVVSDMREKLNLLTEKCNAVKLIEKVQEIPEVAELYNKQQQALVDSLAAKGINAEQVYNYAVQDYQYTHDKLVVLREFYSIKGYKDSNDYIDKINKLYDFEEDQEQVKENLLIIGDKTYIVKVDENKQSGCLFKQKQSEVDPQKGITYGLYEVNNGLVSKDSVCSGITKILASWAGRLYFIKNNRNICRYNTVTREELIVDKARPNDYKDLDNNYNFMLTSDGKRFYFKKRLEIKSTQPGCLALFGKKPEQIENKNNCSVVLIDLETGNSQTVIDEAIDIYHNFNDKIFYTYSPNAKDDKELFMLCDLKTGTKTKILNEHCLIHDVYNEKVVYTLYEPNEYNKSLHVFDLNSGTDKLIENNIYEFFKIIEGKIYYTVGNEDYAPLFSIDFDGKNRTEILRNVENICYVNGGWMYAIRGFGRNKALYKISTDGKKRIFLCSRVQRYVKELNGYVYYTDLSDDLHIVRNDGKDDKVLVSDIVDESIIVDEDYIYFMRNELVEPKTSNVGANEGSLGFLKVELGMSNKDRYNYSLYRMDYNGANIRKLAFDVLAVHEYDNNTILYSKLEKATYEITDANSKDEKAKPIIKQYLIHSYHSYDKKTGQSSLLIALNGPTDKDVQFRSGCFGHKKGKPVFTKVNPTIYKKTGVQASGANFKANSNQTKNAPQSNGCNKGCAPKQKSSAGCGCLKK